MRREFSTRIGSLACAIVALCVSSTTGSATIINVPADHGTIQAGINAAANGDTVLVAPGTYAEKVDLQGKSITLASSGGALVTTIDASSFVIGVFRCAVYIPSTSGTDPVTLQGFTIRGGGGFNQAGPVVSNQLGGGVYVVQGNVQVIGCRIVNNNLNIGGGPQGSFNSMGGGLQMSRGTLLMRDCVVSSNSAQASSLPPSGSAGIGGGVSTLRTSGMAVTTAVFVNCSFSGNQCSGSTGAEGGGIALGGPSVLINCDISGNSSNIRGGGIMCLTGTDVTLVNCRINNNASTSGSGTSQAISAGGGNGGTLRLQACTVAANQSSNPAGAAIVNLGGTVDVTNSVIYPNTGTSFGGAATVQYSCVQGGFAGAGNISDDPLFINLAGGDFRLQPSSPCRDTGDRTLLPSDVYDQDGDGNVSETLSRDLDNVRRIVNGQVDMGAFEWQHACGTDIVPSSPGVAGNSVTDIDDLLTVINAWGVCDQCIADINDDNLVNIDDLLLAVGGWGGCR